MNAPSFDTHLSRAVDRHTDGCDYPDTQAEHHHRCACADMTPEEYEAEVEGGFESCTCEELRDEDARDDAAEAKLDAMGDW